MDHSVTLLTLAVSLLVGLAAFMVHLLKTGIEGAVKSTAEETAKATVRQMEWPAELGRELQKTRGVERQELRYESYGALWTQLRPLAIYDDRAIDRSTAHALSQRLTDWYFSGKGGLLLTPQARDFYFALQDLLRAVSETPTEWTADRSLATEGEHRQVFRGVLDAPQVDGDIGALKRVVDYFSERRFDDWQTAAPDHGATWRKGIAALAARWKDLGAGQRFAILQQVGSILRTSLTNDVESRLR